MFYRQAVSFKTQRKKAQYSWSENKAKQNWYECPCASSLTKCLEDSEKITGSYKSFFQFILKCLHIYSNPWQDVSPL